MRVNTVASLFAFLLVGLNGMASTATRPPQDKAPDAATEKVYRATLAVAHCLVATDEGVKVEVKPVAKGSAVAFDFSAYFEDWQKRQGRKTINIRKIVVTLGQLVGPALYGPDNALSVDSLFGSTFPSLPIQGATLDSFRDQPRLQKGVVIKGASEEIIMPVVRLEKDGSSILLENSSDKPKDHLSTVPLATGDPEKGQKVLIVGRDFDTAKIVSVEGEWLGETKVRPADGSKLDDSIRGAGVFLKQADGYVLCGLVQKRGEKDLTILPVSEIRKHLDARIEKLWGNK